MSELVFETSSMRFFHPTCSSCGSNSPVDVLDFNLLLLSSCPLYIADLRNLPASAFTGAGGVVLLVILKATAPYLYYCLLL